MKKKYIIPSCGLAAVATCLPLATSADYVDKKDGETSIDPKDEIEHKDTPIWSGAKQHGFSEWDEEE